MSQKNEKLIFVYNAKSGLFHKLSDFAHKIISPATYSCQLCMLTHGDFGMKNQWREFLEGLPLAVEFLYKDQLAQNESLARIACPAIIHEIDSQRTLLVDAEAINACSELQELIQLIRRRIGTPSK